MYDIKNMSIWKKEETQETDLSIFENIEISELNLSVRSFNCLKRAGCNTVGQIIKILDEDERGLRKIRNLGSRSEAEILAKIREQRELCKKGHRTGANKRLTIIRPAKKMWDMEISAFHLSNYALNALHACGIRQVKDLYRTNSNNEPGWYAVRELFEKIPSAR